MNSVCKGIEVDRNPERLSGKNLKLLVGNAYNFPTYDINKL